MFLKGRELLSLLGFVANSWNFSDYKWYKIKRIVCVQECNFELFAAWTPLLDINCQDWAILQVVISIITDCDSVHGPSCNLVSFLCKEIWEDAKHICQHRAVICVSVHNKRNKKHLSTSWFTHSWPPRWPHCPLIGFSACHCLVCHCLQHVCINLWPSRGIAYLVQVYETSVDFMFFWGEKHLERNKSVTSSFKPLMLSLTELSVRVFISFFWTGKFPRECVSLWALFAINLFSHERRRRTSSKCVSPH